MKRCLHLGLITRPYCSGSSYQSIINLRKRNFPKPSLDIQPLRSNLDDVIDEMRLRKQEIPLERLQSAATGSEVTDESFRSLALALPNRVHPAVKDMTDDYRIVKTVGQKREYPFEPLSAASLLVGKDLLVNSGLNNYCGDRSYYLIGDAVALEQALIDYTVEKLLAKKFDLLSVPDILSEDLIQSCGMPTAGQRTQVYKLDPDLYGSGWCLSGTAEMAIAGYLMNANFEKESLPKLYSAVSRCYRAEVSTVGSEKGFYRVHQFTKVEMFGVCLPGQSESVLDSFVALQEELFASYGLHYRVLDMSAHELGRQACRKFDVEAWMPGSDRYGELSSASNCSDYQSRRLNIRCGDTFLHTVNGTACAIPRTIGAICETAQIEKGRVSIPEVLRPYTGFDVLGMKRGPAFHRVAPFQKITVTHSLTK